MFHVKVTLIKTFISATILFFLLGCTGAPLIVGSVIEPGNKRDGERTVKVKALLREGRYCTEISFSDPHAVLDWEMSDLKTYRPTHPISVKYIIEIPETKLIEEVDLGEYSKPNFNAAYNAKEFYHEFNLHVDEIPHYRAEVFVTTIFTGSEEGLETYSFEISISEWSCK